MSAVPPPVRCLLVLPGFSEYSFWNPSAVCRLAGRRYMTSPLGLATVAALLPRHWELRLVDMNCRDLSDEELDWADLVMAGAMIIQQLEVLDLVRRAHSRGKPVAVGGPDPSSQPGLYAEADFLVLDEGEITVPLFVRAWEAGERKGVFRSGGLRPDLSASPVPRFDLLRLRDYVYVGVQTSRGCPNSCEFCDIVKLFGRAPRRKSPEQVLAELDALLAAGHRGHVDFSDDNFIGDRRAVKELLRRLAAWSEERGWPFYFSTQVTLDLAADEELLGLMSRCCFRYVFIGIETPDQDLLLAAGKRHNARVPVAESVARIQEAGMLVMAGFILGFDGERTGAARAVASCMEEAGICVGMVGLLTSLPGTELDRRLRAAGRLLIREGGAKVEPGETDQMTGGLNFLPLRPRGEILREYRQALLELYSPGPYFGRLRRTLRTHHRPVRLRGRGVAAGGAWLAPARILLACAAHPRLLMEFLGTLALAVPRGPGALIDVFLLTAYLLHIGRQTRHVADRLSAQIAEVEALGEEGYNRKRRVFVAPTD